MWKFLALLVHVLLLGLLTQIYYQSSIINGLNAQVEHRKLGLEPPADRLVIYVINGLRAESFYRHNFSAVPHLKKLFADHGLIGLSLGSGPSESRPGHIAILGGFQEDASAALRNFQSSPTAFDTLLNRTRGESWVWGPKSVLKFLKLLPTGGEPINMRVHTKGDLSKKISAHEWVYDKVHQFLAVSSEKLKGPSVFLIELDGLCSNGNAAKPNSAAFLSALKNIEETILKITALFERYFTDERTTFLLTSDHGMTNESTHGELSEWEREMPLIFWGAGMNGLRPTAVNKSDKQGNKRLHEIKQIELAPLASALIGLPPPLNNRAMLPLDLMNVKKSYEAHSLHLNALQILAQVEHVMALEERSYIYKWLPRPENLDKQGIQQYHKQFKILMQKNSVAEALLRSQDMIKRAWTYLDFYRVYYRIPLAVACILTYLGWFCYLLAKQARPIDKPKQEWMSSINLMLLGLEVLVALICILHQVSCLTTFSLMLPLPVWALSLRERGVNTSYMVAPITQLAWISATVTLLIASFFYKFLFAVAYLIVVCVNNRKAFAKTPTMKFWVWLTVVTILTGFTIIRPEFVPDNLYFMSLTILITLVRPLLFNERHALRVWLSNAGALLLAVYMVYERLHNRDICCVLQSAAWLYIFYAFISIPYSDTKTPRSRVALIIFNLSTVYSMMSPTYESIFVQLLYTEFLLSMHVQEDLKGSPSDTSSAESDEQAAAAKSPTAVEHVNNMYSYAVFIIVYAYFSMVGTGSLLDINSFDTTFARIFVNECSSIWIGILYASKLMIPIIIIMSCLFAFRTHARQNLNGIFICVFLICDVLSLCFFFFVRNTGSWRTIRSSLSKQLIVHGLPMLFAVFSWLPMLLLSAIPMTMLPMLRWKSSIKITPTDQPQAQASVSLN